MKYRVGLLLALMAFCLGDAQAQSSTADSLRQLLESQPRPDTTRVRRLQALGLELITQDTPHAIALTQQSLELAQHLGDVAGEGRALVRLGTMYRRQANYTRAWDYTQLARRFFVRQGNKVGLAQTCLQLSLIAMVQGRPAAALTAALEGLRLAEQTRDRQTLMYLKVTLGSIYLQAEDYGNALPMLRAGLASAEQLGDLQVMASALDQLGNVYRAQRKWPLAQRYFLRSAQINRKVGDTQNETQDEINLAALFEEQGQHSQALMHGFRARALAYAHHDDYGLPTAELALARTYLATQQPDSAITLAKNGLRMSQQRRSNENIRSASELLARAYAARGDSARAYRYHLLYMAYKDTLSGEEIQRKTSALRYGYELDKKQTQIALLTKTRQLQLQKSARQRLQLYELLAGLGGLLLLAGLLWRNVVLKQRTNRQLNEHNAQIGAQRDDLNRTLLELRATQAQLVQREKMASLGELTAGIAHEIQNPLNFVTNFSELGVELVAELEDLTKSALPGTDQQAVAQLLADLAQNQTKIFEHGRRADRIVKNMLEHSRPSGGQRQATNLNTLADECLRLAYHTWCAKHPEFRATLTRHFDPDLPSVQVIPQDLNRVLLNLLANAFYAVAEKCQHAVPGFQGEVSLHTEYAQQAVWLRVRDNGVGIPAAVLEKALQPFFTTKPTGEGTGLGLSLSYDIITKGHGGTLALASTEGKFTEVTLSLPLARDTS